MTKSGNICCGPAGFGRLVTYEESSRKRRELGSPGIPEKRRGGRVVLRNWDKSGCGGGNGGDWERCSFEIFFNTSVSSCILDITLNEEERRGRGGKEREIG